MREKMTRATKRRKQKETQNIERDWVITGETHRVKKQGNKVRTIQRERERTMEVEGMKRERERMIERKREREND